MRSTALSLRLAGAALLILAAAPAAAADTAPAQSNSAADAGGAPAAAAPAEQPKAEKKICRFDTASGSHLRGTRICMTRAEWRARTQ